MVDREAGFLDVAQEQFGIRKFFAEPGAGNASTAVDTVAGPNLEADVEGLTIYYGPNGTGYLLASSQGDSTFNVYRRQGDNALVGQFVVGPSQSAGVDGAQETDGADVINVPLGPDYPFGLLVVQDGNDEPQFVIDGQLENAAGNFKFIPWEHVAQAFLEPLPIDTTSFDPRDRATTASSTPSGRVTPIRIRPCCGSAATWPAPRRSSLCPCHEATVEQQKVQTVHSNHAAQVVTSTTPPRQVSTYVFL